MILLPFKILLVCFCFLVWLRAHKSSHEPLCDIPPYWMSLCWGRVPAFTISLSFLPFFMWSFYCLLNSSCLIGSQFFFRKNWFIYGYRLSAFMGGGESGVFLHHHVGLPSGHLIFNVHSQRWWRVVRADICIDSAVLTFEGNLFSLSYLSNMGWLSWPLSALARWFGVWRLSQQLIKSTFTYGVTVQFFL